MTHNPLIPNPDYASRCRTIKQVEENASTKKAAAKAAEVQAAARKANPLIPSNTEEQV